MTVGLLSFASNPSVFNGGKHQIQSGVMGVVNDFPLLNYLKTGATWKYNDGSDVNPADLDVNGYPTVINNGGLLSLYYIPTQAARAGNHVTSWDNNGTVLFNGTNTAVAYTITAATNAAQAVLTLSCSNGYSTGALSALNAPAVNQTLTISGSSGGTWTGLNTTVIVQAVNLGASTITVNVNSVGFGTYTGSSGTATNSKTNTNGTGGRYVFAPSSTNPQIQVGIGGTIGSPYMTNLKHYHINDESLVLAGKTFGAQYLSVMRALNPGVIRFVDWQKMGSSTALVTTWSTRKPMSYAIYAGGELRNSMYCGATTNSTDDYSITGNGIDIPASGGPVDKMTLILKFNASATGTLPTLNLNGTGAVQMLRPGGNSISGFVNSRPVINKYAMLVYDAALQGWIKFGGDSNDNSQYLNNGCPYELMVQLCTELGAHPYFTQPYLSADPITDFYSSLAIYVKTTAPSWMIPRFEGCNELWNGLFSATTYAQVKQLVRSGGAVPNGSAVSWSVTDISWTGSGTTGTATLTISGAVPPVGACIITSSSGWTGLSAFSSNTYYVKTVVGQNITISGAPGAGTNPTHGLSASITPNATDYNGWYGYALSQFGQAINSVYGGTPISQAKYQVLAGIQTGINGSAITSATLNSRLASTGYVYAGGSAGYNWATHVCCAQYIRPSAKQANQEMIWAFAYAAGTTSVADSYCDTLDGAADGSANISQCKIYYQNIFDWAQGNVQGKWGGTISLGLCGYEGGYSPDYISAAVTSPISGATTANPCVLTMINTNVQGTTNSGPALDATSVTAGAQLTISGLGGTMGTLLNGNTYSVTAVSGNNVTINVDASGAAFSTAGTATYTRSGVTATVLLNTLRYAGKFSSHLQGYTFGGYLGSQSNYKNFTDVGGVFPSQYTLAMNSLKTDGTGNIGDSGNVWGLYDFGIYTSPHSPAVEGLIAFNAS